MPRKRTTNRQKAVGPRKPPSRAKLAAYRRHWRRIETVTDEFSRQYIHEALSISEVAEDSQISWGTVSRFFHRGKGQGRQTYSLFHGPSFTTIIGIADAIGLELKFSQKRR